jgi:hypothetical protein
MQNRMAASTFYNASYRKQSGRLYNLELESNVEHILDRAGTWFLQSGIQGENGGVARYYRADARANASVSNEITGYACSALAYLHERTGDNSYLEAGLDAAQYLVERAWQAEHSTFPFEPGSDLAYFFDIGIICRGLMALWKNLGRDEFRARAHEGALSLGFDFLGEGVFHPVIRLPEKEPLPLEPRWSRQPGCYQLKSALIWREIGDAHGARMFDVALAMALATHKSFLDEPCDREKLMDRLHAYCYFLEALLAATEYREAREALAWGIARVAALLRKIAPVFERSDVNAQLLRVRLFAHYAGVVRIDERAACAEAQGTAGFQDISNASRLAGGFWFGRKGIDVVPYSNPVSTAFCMQALALWDDHKRGRWNAQLSQLI